MLFLSRLISYLAHPIFAPIVILLIIFNLPLLGIHFLNPAIRIALIIVLIVNNVLLPILSFYLMKRQGIIKSFHMETAQERNIPYILSIVFYTITGILFARTEYLDLTIRFIPIAAATTILGLLIVNNFFKISAHMASIGSSIAYFMLLYFYVSINTFYIVIALILLSGFIASARLYLKAHDEREIYSGFIMGFFATLLVGLYVFFRY